MNKYNQIMEYVKNTYVYVHTHIRIMTFYTTRIMSCIHVC